MCPLSAMKSRDKRCTCAGRRVILMFCPLASFRAILVTHAFLTSNNPINLGGWLPGAPLTFARYLVLLGQRGFDVSARRTRCASSHDLLLTLH